MKLPSKIYPREKLAKIIEKLKKKGKKIGVTNGTFDLLHAGHIKYLNDAKKLCDFLVVSVNTDDSVRLYKDSGRPINSENDRAMVVASLKNVDFVTFHPERHMRETLLALKPDFYIKGGDYNRESLTSKDVLTGWGGQVKIIPLLLGRSTTDIINKIVSQFSHNATEIELPKVKNRPKAVFLDRDGVINEWKEYIYEEDRFIFLPNVFNGLRKIQEKGFKIVIITNQSGIGLGYFTKEDFYAVNRKMLMKFYENGIIISKIYFCPHSLADNCNCKKPKTGMFEKAKEDLNVDIEKSWMIGDKEIDIQAGKSAGCRTILITSGSLINFKTIPDFIAKDLVNAADIIKSNP